MNKCHEIGCKAECCQIRKFVLDKMENLTVVTEKMNEFGLYWKRLDDGGVACSKLVENKCSIYPTRPQICKDMEVEGQACNNVRKLMRENA